MSAISVTFIDEPGPSVSCYYCSQPAEVVIRWGRHADDDRLPLCTMHRERLHEILGSGW